MATDHTAKNPDKLQEGKKKISSRQVAAIVGIGLLVLLYLAALVLSLTGAPAEGVLALCLFATVAVPILLWVYIWMYGKLTGRHTIADFDTGHTKDSGASGDKPTKP